MESSTLFLDLFLGVIGMSYCVYGKKQAHIPALVSGMLLGIFPFFVTNLWLTLLMGIVLVAVPFFIEG